MKAIKFLIGMLLLPTFPPILQAIVAKAIRMDEKLLFLENPLSLMLLGLVIWLFFTFLFHLPNRIYVFAHELSHAIVSKLCGGKVKKVSIQKDRGYIITDRNNFLVVLGPYFLPFYALLLVLITALLSLLIPFHQFQIPFWILLGSCMGYHWTMTFKMLFTRQSDFASQGYIFSYILICLLNLLWILTPLLLLPTPTSFLLDVQHLGHDILRSYTTILNPQTYLK